MQEEPELIGFPAMAGSAVGFGVGLAILDHVFYSATSAINLLVKYPGRAGQVGGDEADIATLRGHFDTVDDLALRVTSFRPDSKLGRSGAVYPCPAGPDGRPRLRTTADCFSSGERCREG